MEIIIYDWCYNELYKGKYDSQEVDEVLLTNRCNCDEGCDKCDHTGYSGDISVEWVNMDINKDKNVYEYINY